MRTTLYLEGCRAEPLGSYLKSLAVLRLVSEQADSEARGFWNGSVFCLESTLTEGDLVDFFLHRYSPTPIVAPWNGGSGFHEVTPKGGIKAISATDDARFREYREAILAVRTMPEFQTLTSLRGAAQSAKKQKGDPKAALVRACRNRLSDRTVDWIDAAIVIRSDDDLAYPPILGTAGNEGRLDYTNNFMCRIVELLLSTNASSRSLLRNALMGELASGFVQSPVGQYDPGRAGGYNQGPGIEHKDVPINSWSFILAIEGAVIWAAGLARRQGVGLARHAVSPFTVLPSVVGYGSAADSDSTAARAEIWMPLWSQPASLEEIRLLLREGRAEIGRRQATDGLQFAEAVSRLGVDRGIDAFARYSLLKRRGDSFVALPATRFPVRHRADADLLQDLDPYLDTVERILSPIPARLQAARRDIERTRYQFTLQGSPESFRRVAAALGRHFDLTLRSLKPDDRKRIVATLHPRWLIAGDDPANPSIEVRIAASLASIQSPRPLASYLVPEIWTGSSLPARLVAALQRRLRDAAAEGWTNRHLAGRIPLHAADIAAFIEGTLNDSHVEHLLYAFALLDWKRDTEIERWSGPVAHRPIPRAWALLKHVFPSGPLSLDGEEVEIRPEPRIVPLLAAGRVRDASEIARRRLEAAGGKPFLAEMLDDPERAPRIAAALLIPVRDMPALSKIVMQPAERNSATYSGR